MFALETLINIKPVEVPPTTISIVVGRTVVPETKTTLTDVTKKSLQYFVSVRPCNFISVENKELFNLLAGYCTGHSCQCSLMYHTES